MFLLLAVATVKISSFRSSDTISESIGDTMRRRSFFSGVWLISHFLPVLFAALSITKMMIKAKLIND